MSAKELVRDIRSIREKIEQVKARGDDWITDCYLDEKKLIRWISEEQLFLGNTDEAFLLYRDRGSHDQLYWGFPSLESAGEIFQRELHHADKKIISDLLFRGDEDAMRKLLLACGFHSYMTFTRMTKMETPQPKQQIDAKWFASLEDLQAVVAILKETMDPECEQLPDQEELAQAISEQRVLVIHDPESGELAAMTMFDRQGALLLWRYWASREKYRRKKLGLLLYQPYIEWNADARRHVLWVRDNNPMKNVYAYFGFRPDGLRDEVFHYEGNA